MGKHNKFLPGLLAVALTLSLAAPAFAAPAPEAPADPAASQPADPSQELTEPPSDPDFTGPEGQTFLDVPADAWYAKAAYYCWNHSLMLGISETEDKFAPEDRMTRATLATVLYRLEDEPEVKADNPFQDVAEGDWYTEAVLWANDVGLMLGYGNGLFGTADPVTRQEMATIIWRYAGSLTPKGTAAGYADQADIPDWAATGVAWTQEKNFIYTEDGVHFLPAVQARRCEIAWTLMQYDLSQIKVDPWEEFEKVFHYRPEKKTVAANQYSMENFVVQTDEEGNRLHMTCQGAPYTVGIDVSSHQKTIDWQAVADSGVDFAMVRIGFRGWGSGAINRDAYFAQNMQGALDAGLQVGAYFFSQAVTIEEAVREAEYAVKMLQDYNVTYPLVFDWERQSDENSRTKDTSYEMVVACAVAFCETVKEAGYIPMFYASPSKAYKMELGYVADYPFWLAHYTTNQAPTSYKYHFDMWQYSSKWSVPGIEGNCDVNICLTDWTAWRAQYMGGAPVEVLPPESTPPGEVLP